MNKLKDTRLILTEDKAAQDYCVATGRTMDSLRREAKEISTIELEFLNSLDNLPAKSND